MKYKTATVAREKGLVPCILWGFGSFLLLNIMAGCILTGVLLKGTLGIERMKIIAPGIQFTAGLIACLLATKLAGHKLLLTAGITTIICLAALIAINILLYDSDFGSVVSALTALGAACAAACTICITTTGKKRRK